MVTQYSFTFENREYFVLNDTTTHKIDIFEELFQQAGPVPCWDQGYVGQGTMLGPVIPGIYKGLNGESLPEQARWQDFLNTVGQILMMG